MGDLNTKTYKTVDTAKFKILEFTLTFSDDDISKYGDASIVKIQYVANGTHTPETANFQVKNGTLVTISLLQSLEELTHFNLKNGYAVVKISFSGRTSSETSYKTYNIFYILTSDQWYINNIIAKSADSTMNKNAGFSVNVKSNMSFNIECKKREWGLGFM